MAAPTVRRPRPAGQTRPGPVKDPGALQTPGKPGAHGIVWFRTDLRLADNPALHAALQTGATIHPVYIWAPDEETPWGPGAAARWWLHQSLQDLDANLRRLGSQLTIRCGPSLETLLALAKATGATSVFWNRRYEPALVLRDKRIKEALQQRGLDAQSFNAALLHEPWTVQNQSQKPFQVFTPFWKHCLAQPDPPAPLPAPHQIPAPRLWPESQPLATLQLEPRRNWADGFKAAWQPGEVGAQRQLQRFLADAFFRYRHERDRPDQPGTSRLSPHLHFGEIGPRQIWHAVKWVGAQAANEPAPGGMERRAKAPGPGDWRSSQFLTELGWREFAHHLLYHFPKTPTEPLRAEFKKFPWHSDQTFLQAWKKGQTGYPIVDAGMRELWATGWMHNRVRMVVASFLVKDLLWTWTEGAAWFWDTLVDADLAQNTLGWQWTAGCGADAAPYFRVFNPIGQGEKFDPQGSYVRRWCPELAPLPDPWIHHPWEAPASVLAQAGIELGRNYPEPIVSHGIARDVALEAFAKLKRR